MAYHAYGIFECSEQAEQHIFNRIVLFNGRGVQVVRILSPEHNIERDEPEGPAKLRIYDPYNGGFDETVPIDDPGFNSFRFDPLGWLNHPSGAIMAELVPVRQTRRGYGQENVHLWTFSREEESLWMDHPNDVGFDGVMYSEALQEMLRGEYPEWTLVAQEALRYSALALAVSRRYAVRSDRDGYVWLYRDCARVGLVADAYTVVLGNRFKYLREELEECPVFGLNGVVVK